MPKDQGRPYLFGWEFEGGLEPWTDSMHEFMAQCSGATLQWLGQPIDCHGEHSTWAFGRKIDRLGYTATTGRERIRAAGLKRRQEHPMANLDAEQSNQVKRLIEEVLENHPVLVSRADGKDLTVAQALERIEANSLEALKLVQELG